MRVAIQPDDYTDPATGREDASSPRWAALLEQAGHEVRFVDVRAPGVLAELRECQGFMWRYAHLPGDLMLARRLLPVLEHLGLAVYPDHRTAWHFDDKVAQALLLEGAGLPAPRTWVLWSPEQARDFARTARFPLVLKLAAGAGSTNVRLLADRADAERWFERLFGPGVRTLAEPAPQRLRKRARVALDWAVRGVEPDPGYWFTLHKNYALVQEFLADNAFDTRVTVIGRRAFGFRRMNRPGDFRASGSGRLDHDPAAVDLETVRLAFRVAERLGTQSVAIDGLRRGDERVVAELSYAYASWAVHACPGHWELRGADLAWSDGPMWPEEAQIEDFLARLTQRAGQ